LIEKNNEIDQIFLTSDVEIGQLKMQIGEKTLEINTLRKDLKTKKLQILSTTQKHDNQLKA